MPARRPTRALQEQELGTFYLTDFLARQFESIIVAGLGLDRHPELRPDYFGSYRRLVYLAQTDDQDLTARARAAADRLGLAFERRATGFGDLAPTIRRPSTGGTARSGRPCTTTIWWRDIPAQVIARDGRRASKIVLHPRFQVAIDKAASRAGKRSYNDYIEEWRKEQRLFGGDIDAAVAAEVERLETDYDKHKLAQLIQSGGVEGGPAHAPAGNETQVNAPEETTASMTRHRPQLRHARGRHRCSTGRSSSSASASTRPVASSWPRR